MHRRFLLLALGLSLAACTGKLEGTACLDGNGNNICEAEEHTLTSVSLKISKDNQFLAQARTNSLGRFSHGIRDRGCYCVEVDEPHLSQSLMFQLTYGQLPADSVQSVQSSVALGPPLGMSAKQVGSPPDSGGTTDTTTTTQPQADEEEEQPVFQPSPGCPDSAEPGKVCKNVTGFSQTLHVPVMVDYQADVDRMPPRLEQERRAGEVFTVPIPVSIGCVLETIYLPDGLIPLWPTTVEEINKILNIDRETGRIDFRPQARPTSVVLHLKVREDLPLRNDDYDVQIQPVMLCPGNQRLELNEIPIVLISRPLLDVFQELPAGAQAEGTEFDWSIVLNNEGSQALALDIVGTANGPIAALTPSSGLCRSLGSNRVECTLDVEGGQTVRLTIGVRLLEEVESVSSALFDATAEVEDSAETFSASQGTVSLDSGDD